MAFYVLLLIMSYLFLKPNFNLLMNSLRFILLYDAYLYSTLGYCKDTKTLQGVDFKCLLFYICFSNLRRKEGWDDEKKSNVGVQSS